MKQRFLAICLLVLPLAVRAAEPAPPEDEWWKKAQVPKKHAPMSWYVGVFIGFQDWSGLKDYEPTPAERAAGARGAFGTTSGSYGFIGSLEAGRFGSIGVGVDMLIDVASFDTTESAVPYPNPIGEPPSDHEFSIWRVGIAGRSTFRQASRVQPTASVGAAYDHNSVHTVFTLYDFGTYVTRYSYSKEALDLIATGGVDIATGKDVRRGWRVRLEARIEHRGFSEPLFGFGYHTPGPLAYGATVGLLYRHEPR